MAVPATPQNFRVTSAQVKDAHHVVLTVACDPVAGATEYRWFHEFGSPYMPFRRLIDTTASPTLVVGTTPPFIVAPGHPYLMAVEAVNSDGASVPNAQSFEVPAWVSPDGPTLGKPFAVIPVQVVADSMQFVYGITGPGGTQDVPFIFDSGAFEMLLTEAVATTLSLPNLGNEMVGGVGGSATAWMSKVSFTLGGRTYTGVDCVVDPQFTQNLFGAKWWIDNKVMPLLDPTAQTISFYDA